MKLTPVNSYADATNQMAVGKSQQYQSYFGNSSEKLLSGKL